MRRFDAAMPALRRRWKRARTNPFVGSDRPLLVHACYHKAGTVWFRRVLRSVASEYGMTMEVGRGARALAPSGQADIFLQQQSRLDIASLGDFRGTHVVRDPRDTVVSAYLYHRWTDEPWANRARPEYGGASYREHLGTLDREEGLATEIERLAVTFERMTAWDYDDPRFLELRFEDIRAAGPPAFEPIFRHYGFSDAAVERGLHWATYHSWENTKQREADEGQDRPSHLRSPRSGEWREVLSEAHVARIEELVGPLMRRLGYT